MRSAATAPPSPPSARHVRIDPDAEIELGGIAGLDEQLHFLEGAPEDVARYVLILDAINFGSGWFGELGTTTDALTERADGARARRAARGPSAAAARARRRARSARRSASTRRTG